MSKCSASYILSPSGNFAGGSEILWPWHRQLNPKELCLLHLCRLAATSFKNLIMFSMPVPSLSMSWAGYDRHG